MTPAHRIVAAVMTATLAFVMTSATPDAAPSPGPTPTPKPTTRVPKESLANALACLGDTSASDTVKLNCVMDIEAYADKDGYPAGTQAFIPLATTCFKDPSYFVRLAAARTIPRIPIKRDAVVNDELKLFLDPKVIASTDCLHQSEVMGLHLTGFMKDHKFSQLQKLGMIDTIWDALLNGDPLVQKNALGEFYLVLGKGSPKELAPYKDRAERYFDFLFSPAAAKLDEENFITISIDQMASILFAMGDYAFLGNHLLTPIASYVLYPNAKNPHAVSPDARWGYADDLNYNLRDRMNVALKWDPASAKVWANALQVLIIAATPVTSQRQCIDREAAMENLVFAGHEVQQLAVQTLVELANEPPKGAEFGAEERGCGEIEARVLGTSGHLQTNNAGSAGNTVISTGTDITK
ncbi:MAG TPA: hypothetical protein VMD07_08405 [Candidatus Acidoferrales bacterium]|nr:hypothetical protein [Candidatus Acidoferrales bacterium]